MLRNLVARETAGLHPSFAATVSIKPPKRGLTEVKAGPAAEREVARQPGGSPRLFRAHRPHTPWEGRLLPALGGLQTPSKESASQRAAERPALVKAKPATAVRPL